MVSAHMAAPCVRRALQHAEQINKTLARGTRHPSWPHGCRPFIDVARRDEDFFGIVQKSDHLATTRRALAAPWRAWSHSSSNSAIVGGNRSLRHIRRIAAARISGESAWSPMTSNVPST